MKWHWDGVGVWRWKVLSVLIPGRYPLKTHDGVVSSPRALLSFHIMKSRVSDSFQNHLPFWQLASAPIRE